MIRLWSLLFCGLNCYGCFCVAWPSAPQAWAHSPVVFLGVVTSVDSPIANNELDAEFQIARVLVLEPFKGSAKGREFVLRQPMNNCYPKFTSGQSVVLYLDPSGKNSWVAHGCNRPTSMADVADDLLFLRALPNSAKSNRLSGTVSLYEISSAEGRHKLEALAGLAVSVSGKARSTATTTNRDGVFEFYGLPPGDYDIAIEFPPGLKLDFSSFEGGMRKKSDSRSVSMEGHSAVSVNFQLKAETSISGRVLGPDGQLMPNVCVDLEPLGETTERFNVYDCTNSGGTFVLKAMSAGSYKVSANRSGEITAAQPFPATYYPGVVTVSRGERRAGVDLRIPKLEPTVNLSGKVEFSDGLPVPKASVELMIAGYTAARATTGPTGEFTFSALEGNVGELSATIVVWETTVDLCPAWSRHRPPSPAEESTVSSIPLAISPKPSQPPILITLPLESCQAWSDAKP